MCGLNLGGVWSRFGSGLRWRCDIEGIVVLSEDRGSDHTEEDAVQRGFHSAWAALVVQS